MLPAGAVKRLRSVTFGEVRTTTSTLTQLLSSDFCQRIFFYYGVLRPQRPYGLLGTGSPGRPPRLSHSSRVLISVSASPSFMVLYVYRIVSLISNGEPGTATSTFTQLLSPDFCQRAKIAVLKSSASEYSSSL